MFLVCPMRHAAVIVDIDGKHRIVPLDEDVRIFIIYSCYATLIVDCLIVIDLQSDLNIVASFDRRGQYVFTGNSKGRVLVLSCTGLEVKASFRVGSSVTAVKSIEFARRGEYV